MICSQAAVKFKAAELCKAEPGMLFLKMKVSMVTTVTCVLNGIPAANVCFSEAGLILKKKKSHTSLAELWVDPNNVFLLEWRQLWDRLKFSERYYR